MKTKLVLICICSILLFASANAQVSKNDSKFNFGLKISPSIAWLSFSPNTISSDGAKIGFGYGLMADINFATNYSFGTGLEVTYRGGKSKVGTLSADYTFQYIEIPLTLKLKTNEIGYITYFGKFGFSPGFNLSAVETLKDNGNTIMDQQGIMSGTLPINVSLVVGAGAQYSLGGKTALMLGVTYNNGFLDIAKSSALKITTSFISLDIGLYF